MFCAPFGWSVFDDGRVGTYPSRQNRSNGTPQAGEVRQTYSGSKLILRRAQVYPQIARRYIAAEERQARAALLLRPPRRRRYLPPDLDAIRPRATTRDFGRIPRVAARAGQALVQERGRGRRGVRRAEE
jgi:hypothetical protein